jgi:hypothetical protein
VVRAFDDYEQLGTPILMQAMVEEWCVTTFGPAFTTPTVIASDADADSPDPSLALEPYEFFVAINVEAFPDIAWLTPTYGSTYQYGQSGLVYGLYGNASQIQEIRSVVRKWKFATRKGRIVLMFFSTGTTLATFYA